MDETTRPWDGLQRRVSRIKRKPVSHRRALLCLPGNAVLFAATMGMASFAFGEAVGYTAGQFSVDPTGAASYRIPIQVPPGVRGMQPEVALLYNSRAGNSQVGVGWSLAGLSVISRCPKTRAQDGAPGGVHFDPDDRFCLDGQRLMVLGGAVYGAANNRYRTEIESFQEVQSEGVAGSGPLSFSVRDKSGLRREYGGSADARLSAVDGSVCLWLLRRITDKFGNFIQYSYNTSDTEYTLTEISYGNGHGTTLARVVFTHENRPDTTSHFVAGKEITGTRRLSGITTDRKSVV